MSQPKSPGLPQLWAIYVCLGETDLFVASLSSVYDHVAGVTVITNGDRDWRGNQRDDEGLVDLLTSRKLDPDRKIDILVCNETSEARARNRAMDFASPSRASTAVAPQVGSHKEITDFDYFLIVDADEIWTSKALTALREFIATDRLPAYRANLVPYFKTWNWRINVSCHSGLVALRRDWRTWRLRDIKVSLWRRAASKALKGLAPRAAAYIRREATAPADVVFHHGSYVGPRSRIEAKLAGFGHAHEIVDGWLETTYDTFTPTSTDLHPVHPHLFPSVTHVSPKQLPGEVAGTHWPPGYLDVPDE